MAGNNKNRKSTGRILRKRIPISVWEWESMHPFQSRYDTDSYYCRLANKLMPCLDPLISSQFYTQLNAKELALAVAAYFEDVVSELGIWRTFIEKHKKLYGKWLPWYDTSNDYYEDEVNLQDVQFVLWTNMMRMREERVVNPENLALREMAESIYAVLEEEFEEAPINDDLIEDVYGTDTTENFGKLKGLLSWMGSTSYLLKTSVLAEKEKEDLRSDLEKNLNMQERPGLSQYVTDSYWAVNRPTGPLALLPKEWYALMREQRGIGDFNDEIRSIEGSPLYPYLIVRNDGIGDLLLRSAREREYNVDRDSFEFGSEAAIQEGYVLCTTLASYCGKWHINGFSSTIVTDDMAEGKKRLKELGDLLIDERGVPMDILGNLDFDASEGYTANNDPKLVEKAVKANKGSRLFYFGNIHEAIDWQIKAFELKGAGDLPEESAFNLGGPVAVFLSKEGRLSMMSDVEMIADPANPYYRKGSVDDGELDLIADKGLMPIELVEYLIERGFTKHLSLNSVHGRDHGRKLLQDNLHFMTAYLRQEPLA